MRVLVPPCDCAAVEVYVLFKRSDHRSRTSSWMAIQKYIYIFATLVCLQTPAYLSLRVVCYCCCSCLLQAPKVFKGPKLDGPTLHAVFYFTLKEETAKALQDLESAEPSVRLLAEYSG